MRLSPGRWVTALLACLLSSAIALPEQLPLSQSGGLETASVTLVDVLSHDRDFSLFMSLLQKARLIPTLNKLHNATLFVPTNDAVRARFPDSQLDILLQEESEEQQDTTGDNLQYRLRERLFYHLLNYSFIDEAVPEDGTVSLETTLLYPTLHDDHGRPGHVPYPPPERTLLGGEGQKLAVARTSAGVSTVEGSPSLSVGVNSDGKNGSKVISGKGGHARNGRVIAIDKVLEPPKPLSHLVKERSNGEHGELSMFAGLLSDDLWKALRERPHATLFAPTNAAFDALEPLELKYLASGFAEDDIIEIANNHESVQADAGNRMDRVGYLDRLIRRETVPLLSGDSVTVKNEDGVVKINGSSISTANLLASNGVMHIVDKLLLPHGSLALTPEKYLLALNATRFVSLFRAAGLANLLQSSEHNPENNGSYTILATKDEVLERWETTPWQSLPPTGSRELKETLKYHVIEGKWTKKQLRDGQLLRTSLQSEDLAGEKQRIPVSVSRADNNLRSIKDDTAAEIGFGSANVIAEPIDIGNSIIYLVSRILEPPPTFVAASLDKGLSTFVASVYASESDKDLLKHHPATTFLAPKNNAFEYLGLAMNYFLLSSSRAELGQLLRYHAIKGIQYADELPYDSEHYETLEGSDIYLERGKNASSRVHVRGPRIGGFPANGDNRDARIVEADLLTSTGVLHIIDQVEIPPTMNITSEKLMRGAKASTFPDLLRQTNLSWIAESKPAPEDFFETYTPYLQLAKRDQDKIKKSLFKHDSYTILCPTDKAFTRINLTHYLNDIPALLQLVQLHIIPSPPPGKGALSDPMKFPSDGKPLALADQSTFSTLLSASNGGSSKYGDLAFRSEGSEGDWIVGIKGATGTDGKHDNARVIAYGRNTPRFASEDEEKDVTTAGNMHVAISRPKMFYGGGVLLLDAVLEPYEPNWLHRWGYIAIVAFFSLVAAACIGLLGWKLYDRRRKHASQYEALRQDNEED